jgi:hypothetical protein
MQAPSARAAACILHDVWRPAAVRVGFQRPAHQLDMVMPARLLSTLHTHAKWILTTALCNSFDRKAAGISPGTQYPISCRRDAQLGAAHNTTRLLLHSTSDKVRLQNFLRHVALKVRLDPAPACDSSCELRTSLAHHIAGVEHVHHRDTRCTSPWSYLDPRSAFLAKICKPRTSWCLYLQDVRKLGKRYVTLHAKSMVGDVHAAQPRLGP